MSLTKQRVKLLSLAIFFTFIALTGRLFYWQIIKGPELREKAKLQTYKLEKITPQRGQIYSSDNFPLVLNQISYQISIYKPNLKDDLNNVINQINTVYPDFITINQKNIDNFKNNSSQKWITFPTLFTSQQKDQLKISGLEFEKIDKRFYPEGDMAKELTGIVAKNSQGIIIGYGGLEAYYQNN